MKKIIYLFLSLNLFAGTLKYNFEMNNSKSPYEYEQYKMSNHLALQPTNKLYIMGEKQNSSHETYVKEILEKEFDFNNAKPNIMRLSKKSKDFIDISGIVNKSYTNNTNFYNNGTFLEDNSFIFLERNNMMVDGNNFFYKDDYHDELVLNVQAVTNRREITPQALPYTMLSENLKILFRSGQIFVQQKEAATSDATVVKGMVIASPHDDIGLYGTSFSTPYLAKVIYLLKDKFPYYSYSQIKQILFTTATRNFYGDKLGTRIGWGILNLDKALKGLSNLNAGLIDEQKFYTGMPDKIYDKNGNTYFWLDTPKNETIVWSNDIDSGLTEDTNNFYTTVYEHKNVVITKDIENEKEQKIKTDLTTLRLIPSEFRFYKDYATAGLRKDGLGTLILNGKQKYDGIFEMFKGKTILNNSSNALNRIYEDATLEIHGNNLNVRAITVDGKLDLFTKNLTINVLNVSDISKVSLDVNSNTRIKSLRIYSKNPNKFIEPLKKSGVKIDEIQIHEPLRENGSMLDDIYVNLYKYAYIPFGKKTKKLKDLDLNDSYELDSLASFPLMDMESRITFLNFSDKPKENQTRYINFRKFK